MKKPKIEVILLVDEQVADGWPSKVLCGAKFDDQLGFWTFSSSNLPDDESWLSIERIPMNIDEFELSDRQNIVNLGLMNASRYDFWTRSPALARWFFETCPNPSRVILLFEDSSIKSIEEVLSLSSEKWYETIVRHAQ